MASKHTNHGLRVVSSDSSDDSRHETGTLAKTAFSGKARLRELEQLAKTARRVREDAETELSDSRTSRAIAEQRIATCERTLRKAEDEMAILRAELYRREQDGNEEAEFESAEDFELAVLLGKAARHEEPTAEAIADLQLSPLPSPKKTRSPGRTRPAPFRSTPRDTPKRTREKSRRLGFTLLVAMGALIGASLTYTALTTRSIQENVKVLATDPARIVDELKGKKITPEISAAQTNHTEASDTDLAEPEPVIPVTPEPANTVKLETAAPPDTKKAPAPRANIAPDLFRQRALEEQRARVINQAEVDLKSRLANHPAASSESSSGGQVTTQSSASHL